MGAAGILGSFAEVPALPLHTAGKYVAGAYVVLFAIVLIYVAIMAIRLSRIERDLGELLELTEGSGASPARGRAASVEEPALQESALQESALP
jgi:hypothetical protein